MSPKGTDQEPKTYVNVIYRISKMWQIPPNHLNYSKGKIITPNFFYEEKNKSHIQQQKSADTQFIQKRVTPSLKDFFRSFDNTFAADASVVTVFQKLPKIK